jgi:cytochrome c oxidase subunit 2
VQTHQTRRGRVVLSALLASLLLFLSSPASLLAAETRDGWGRWWLPPDHSTHGAGIDALFNWIFWITMITFIVVEIVLVVFLVKYRHREGRKALFTHGNTRLEMCWTLAPAVILAVLALASKKVWDNFRYAPTSDDPNRAIVLVVGEQFKWNFVYPGPDGKLGTYLKFPKPTDERWSNPDKSGKPFIFRNVKGPAELPYTEAVAAINAYIQGENPLGIDFDDPNGKDDNWEKQPARGLTLPRGRPIEVQLSSKDVIHDFFLPNFRVKLDAVPGMRGHIYFQTRQDMPTSKEREQQSTKPYKLDEVAELLKNIATRDLNIVITEADQATGATYDRRARQWLYKDAKGTIIRDGQALTGTTDDLFAKINRLKAIGVTEVKAFVTGDWELVCEELCGANHYTMRGSVRFVSNDEYDALKFDKPYRSVAPTTAPSVAVGAAAAR